MADKAVIFSCSPRKTGKSHIITNELIPHLENHQYEVEIITPYTLEITDCIGCERCRDTKRCIYQDDLEKVSEKLNNAKMVLTVSPVYFYTLPSPFIRLIDRFQSIYYRDKELPRTIPGYAILYGATKGKKLFEGTSLTLRYFYDSFGSKLKEFHGIRNIEHDADIITSMPEIKQFMEEQIWK